MDTITATAAALENTPREVRDNGFSKAYPLLATKLQGCPRYLFDDAAIGTAVELTLGRPKILRAAMQHLRLPYPRMWVEWSETGREELRRKLGTRSAPLTSIPTRLGFLIESDPETGRRGQVIWAWSHTGDSVANIAAVAPEFDLDRKFPQPQRRRDGLMRAELAQVWLNYPEQLTSLLSIWETALHKVTPWGEAHLDTVTSALPGGRAHHEDRVFSDVYGEYILVWSVLLLLTAARPVVEYKPVSLTKLNKQRRKKKQVPLLDHTEVSLYLHTNPKHNQQRGVGQPLSYLRKSPRVHLVSSYLARRGDKHWVCQPYWRGSGDTIHRRVSVRG